MKALVYVGLELFVFAGALALVGWYFEKYGKDLRVFTPGTREYKIAVGLVLSAALLVVLNPEVRLLLLFAEAIGVDVVFLLIFVQLRAYFTAFCGPAVQYFRRLGAGGR